MSKKAKSKIELEPQVGDSAAGAEPTEITNSAPTPRSKIAKVIDLLQSPDGVTISDICQATGWLPHSVRGAISGQLRRVRGLNISSRIAPEGRRYFIEGGA